MEWQYHTRNKIGCCDISYIDSVTKDCLCEAEQSLEHRYLKLNTELVKLLEKDKRLTQWHRSTETWVKYMNKEHKYEAGKYCSNLSQCRKTVQQRIYYTSSNDMEKEIIAILNIIYQDHNLLIAKQLNMKPLSERDALTLDITHLHLESTRWISKLLRQPVLGAVKQNQYAKGKEQDIHCARVQTDYFFCEVKRWMEEIMKRCQDFSKTSVANLLMKLQNSVNKFNSDNHNCFIFTSRYQVDIAIIVVGYVYQQFTAKVKQLALENNPVEAMNRDKTAAYTLGDVLIKSIKKAVMDKIPSHIVSIMKQDFPHFHKKSYFKALILKDLVAAKDFELYKVYLKDSTTSLKDWSKIYVTQYCEKNLFKLAAKILKIETERCIDFLYKDFSICDIKKWLGNFVENAKHVIAIDLQEIMFIPGINRIQNVTLFTEHLRRSLESTGETFLAGFKSTDAIIKKLTEMENSPYLLLYNSLAGCKDHCPFCKEECDFTDGEHSGRPHFTQMHRPWCLGGYTTTDNKLDFQECTEIITTDATFTNSETNHKPFPYKDYRRIYPTWFISYKNPTIQVKYWRWFIATYSSKIAEWNGVQGTPIIDQGWLSITEKEAIISLDEIYGLQS